jgi:hypothetical protein
MGGCAETVHSYLTSRTDWSYGLIGITPLVARGNYNQGDPGMGSASSGATGKRRRPAARGSPQRSYRPLLQSLEERVVPALTLVGHWNNGTGLFSDGWATTQNGRHYAYIGHYGNNNGIHVVDITDPSNPILVDNFLSPSGWNDFRDVELVKRGNRRTFGFFSSDIGGGLIVANANNPNNLYEVKRITSAQGGTNTVHTLSVDGNYLYEADSRTSTIRVFNITNPSNPVWLRNITSATESVHEVTAINGRLYAAGIFDSPRVEIYDISQIGDLSKPVTRLGTIFSGTRAHTAWPTEDGQYVAVAHERQGGNLSFWNVTNPGAPSLAWTMTLPTSQAYSVHQVMTMGNRLYVSWYQAGIYVYDITNRNVPVLLGNYDTYVGAVNGFQGAWGVYPFLGDNKILGFDMQGGLYILSLSGRSDTGDEPRVTPTITVGPDEAPVGLHGGVLRIVLNDVGQEVSISRNVKAGTIDVTLDGETTTFAESEVLRFNVYGGDGNDRFVFDPTIFQPIFVDGGAGENSVKGWPAFLNANVKSLTQDHCATVMGTTVGNHYEARSIQTFEGFTPSQVAALATSALAGHGAHRIGFSGITSNGSTIVTGDHAMAMAGVSTGTGRGDSMSSGAMMHGGGGKISPELMVRTSTNSQVGGQVAYHKPG